MSTQSYPSPEKLSNTDGKHIDCHVERDDKYVTDGYNMTMFVIGRVTLLIIHIQDKGNNSPAYIKT